MMNSYQFNNEILKSVMEGMGETPSDNMMENWNRIMNFVPDYSGDIYVLTDKYSASCSEYSLAILYALSKNSDIKIHHIGENTRGAIFYIDPSTFVTPNSGAWMVLPTGRNYSDAFNHPDFHGEGYGWFPEYWVTQYNLLNTLCNLIDDKELEKALQGLEKWQLQ